VDNASISPEEHQPAVVEKAFAASVSGSYGEEEPEWDSNSDGRGADDGAEEDDEDESGSEMAGTWTGTLNHNTGRNRRW
jgi:hypothetical protein